MSHDLLLRHGFSASYGGYRLDLPDRIIFVRPSVWWSEDLGYARYFCGEPEHDVVVWFNGSSLFELELAVVFQKLRPDPRAGS